MKKYFIWQDKKCNGINPEWLEISGMEFYHITKTEPKRRFIIWKNEDNPMDDGVLYEVTKEQYMEWDRERKSKKRMEEYLEENYTFFSLDEYVGREGKNELTWLDIIPDNSQAEAKAESKYEEKKQDLVANLKIEIEKLSEEDKKLIYEMFLNPNGKMSEMEYAEANNITQQAVSKRKLKIFKNLRAAMVVKNEFLSNREVEEDIKSSTNLEN